MNIDLTAQDIHEPRSTISSTNYPGQVFTGSLDGQIINTRKMIFPPQAI